VGEKATIVPIIGDLKDDSYVDYIIGKLKVDVIFHTAAYKHVPMMEENPVAAIENNVFGTENLIKAARKYGVKRFVLISTDKAVDPVSVYGASKFLCEQLVLSASKERGAHFMVVRFGNVLGSRGSIMPLFQKQIEKGGPVTVTHPEARRWFMTIPEACSLVLKAGGVGENGKLYLLDMGEPVKIVQLAMDLITLSGLRPHEDIEIQFSGIRPGEKLFEELSITGEDVARTAHPKIGIIKKRPEDFQQLCAGIGELVAIMDTGTAAQIRDVLQQIVPEYTPSVTESTKPDKAPASAPVLSPTPATSNALAQPHLA
jgi:FlaA1/EpsC-like NDP-sugar epimerase